MTIYAFPAGSFFGGITLDLDREQIDVVGARWAWTGDRDQTGMPLMQTGNGAPQRLTEIYSQLGPFIPAPRPVTADEQRAVLSAPAGTGPVVQAAKTCPTPRTVAGLLGRLRGRSA